MLDWSTCPAVERDPENLEGGATVEQFLEWFPGVAREQVNAVLAHTRRA